MAVGVAQYSGTDGDGDGNVDQGDYEVWKANFGWVAESGGGGGGAVMGSVSGLARESAESTLPPALPKGENSAGAGGRVLVVGLRAELSEQPPALPGVLWSFERGVGGGGASANWRGQFWRRSSEHLAAVDRALVAWVAERAGDVGDRSDEVSLEACGEQRDEVECAPADNVFAAFGVRRAIGL